MIEKDEAARIALEFIRGYLADECPTVVLVPDMYVENPECFMFAYDTAAAAGGDYSDGGLAGNYPVYVDRVSGEARLTTDSEWRANFLDGRFSAPVM